MKLGVITDIHNNLTALLAMMDRLNQQECDQIVCCGDLIGIGPYPEETVQCMMNIPNLIAVRGNHEKYLLEGMPSEFPNEERMGIEEVKHHEWEHALLSEESVRFLKRLPYRAKLTWEGCRVVVMHYCMDYDGHYVDYVPDPSAADLDRIFAGIEADVILYGHNHARSIVRSDRLYVNAGALGCPARERNIARAAIVSIVNGHAEVQPIDVVYDAQAVLEAITEKAYPDADNIKRFFYGIW